MSLPPSESASSRLEREIYRESRGERASTVLHPRAAQVAPGSVQLEETRSTLAFGLRAARVALRHAPKRPQAGLDSDAIKAKAARLERENLQLARAVATRATTGCFHLSPSQLWSRLSQITCVSRETAFTLRETVEER